VAVEPSGIEGRGLFATEELAAGVILLRLSGRLVSSDELAQLIEHANADPSHPYVDTLTIYEGAHLVLPPDSLIHFGNHSCDPTMWHVGPYEIATRRIVRTGEELTIDYGTQSGADGFSMTCRCGSALCRRVVSSDDWAVPALQERYRHHWVPALETRIAAP
jgi:SET domain-containing protein